MKYFFVKSEMFGTVRFEKIEIRGENGSITTICQNPVLVQEFKDPEKFALSYEEMMRKIQESYSEYSEHQCGRHAYYQACGCCTVNTVWHGDTKFENMRHYWPCHSCDGGIVGVSSNGERKFYCASHDNFDYYDDGYINLEDYLEEKYSHLVEKFELAYPATAR